MSILVIVIFIIGALIYFSPDSTTFDEENRKWALQEEEETIEFETLEQQKLGFNEFDPFINDDHDNHDDIFIEENFKDSTFYDDDER